MIKYRVTTTTGDKVRSVDFFHKESAIKTYNDKRNYYMKHGFQLVDAGGNGDELCELWIKEGHRERNIEIYPININ